MTAWRQSGTGKCTKLRTPIEVLAQYGLPLQLPYSNAMSRASVQQHEPDVRVPGTPPLSRFLAILFVVILRCLAGQLAVAAAPAQLQISDNKRFLITDQGKPFFYLGDTCWELFHRLNRDEAIVYLEDRARKRFTVIQAVALAELNGLNVPNAYGHRPLRDNDPTKPDIQDGQENDYWDHVDFIVSNANARGLVVGFLPTWGDKWNKKWGVGPEIFTPENAEQFGKWLGERYQQSSVIWILGGDRPIASDRHREIIDRLAKGLREGDGGAHLQTFHTVGGHGSAEYFHDAAWLDFNMRQNGHVVEFTGRYEQTRVDYDRTPPKPVIDGEPVYEGHPISFEPDKFGYSLAADVRRPLYWNLFSGACGHTYGHHSVWQMWSSDVAPVNRPLTHWHEAINAPGAAQMQHARALLESRPFLTRIPDDTVIVADAVPLSVPGAGRYRFVATRDESGSYAMIYVPVGRTFRVRMNAVTGTDVKAWWFNPRDGFAKFIGNYKNSNVERFTPPNPGELLDWVLVLDDASKLYPPPGSQLQ
jgi:hypothetical protein